MKSWGNHEGYRYAHDWPGAVAPQQYMPDELAGREYYHPNDRGYEHEIKPRLEKIRKILHEKDGGQTGNSDRA
jgi:putative ATPase